jgi:hypothetical protein
MNRMTWRSLLQAYLIFKIVACPLLCGSTPHHAYSQCFQAWATKGSLDRHHHHGGDMEGPVQSSPEHGPCFCDGVELHCPDSPLDDDDPGDLLLVLIDPFAAAQPWVLVEEPGGRVAGMIPSTSDLATAPSRADLQNFRC